ncbi:MAG: transposase [Actinomycetia bacterium]|nr:transposase [Actinomycetes bacterium]
MVKSAAKRHFQGISWQRCQVHFTRNAAGKVKRERRKEPSQNNRDDRESCLRLISALCVEQSEEWTSGKRYLNMEELVDSEGVSF